MAFDGAIPEISANAQYVVLDDVYTLGGSVRALMEHIQKQGGNIKAVSTLGSSRFGNRIKPSKIQLEKLRHEYSLTDKKIKEIAGYEIEYFTGAEIQAILGCRSKNKSCETFKRFFSPENVEGSFGKGGRNHQQRSSGTSPLRKFTPLFPSLTGPSEKNPVKSAEITSFFSLPCIGYINGDIDFAGCHSGTLSDIKVITGTAKFQNSEFISLGSLLEVGTLDLRNSRIHDLGRLRKIENDLFMNTHVPFKALSEIEISGNVFLDGKNCTDLYIQQRCCYLHDRDLKESMAFSR